MLKMYNAIVVVMISALFLTISFYKYDEDDKFACLELSFLSGFFLGVVFIWFGLGKG